MKFPSISVAMGTFNGHRFIEEQLLSIFAQTYLPRELIICDDCSTDNTLSVIQRVISREMASRKELSAIRVEIVTREQNIGVALNFLDAFTMSGSDLIAICDQDDIWAPNKLETFAHLFAQDTELVLAHSNAELINSSGQPLGRTMFEALKLTRSEFHDMNNNKGLNVLLRRNIISGTACVIRRDVVLASLPVPETWYPDEWFGICATQMGKIRTLSNSLVYYRQHSTNTVGAPQSIHMFHLFRHWIRHSRAIDLKQRVLHWDALINESRLPQNESNMALIHSAIRFYSLRSSLPRLRIARLPRVISLLFKGDYKKYSFGNNAVLSDLVQRA